MGSVGARERKEEGWSGMGSVGPREKEEEGVGWGVWERENQARSERIGSLVGVTSDSECEDKKSSASSTGAADAGRAFSSASPQTGAALVTSHDYNMEQSNVALLRAELKTEYSHMILVYAELKISVVGSRQELIVHGYYKY
ncbi:hypothetical protein Pcinc_042208 [Petrolisthes cinctipes]|uniref:Uncharacterized protein n=1 Tax=Petrolisthes cinctipes TaxID=88211 RepID=A0AAE1BIG5_PETCI|nr:hypothetical protein Pcinc_042208 [Petrolisthes cinctipes]